MARFLRRVINFDPQDRKAGFQVGGGGPGVGKRIELVLEMAVDQNREAALRRYIGAEWLP